MCRNITALRGLEPPATDDEIHAAALQYVRKVGGLSSISPVTQAAVNRAVAEVAAATARLLAELPDRRVPPKNLPPLRRLAGGHHHDGPDHHHDDDALGDHHHDDHHHDDHHHDDHHHDDHHHDREPSTPHDHPRPAPARPGRKG